MANAKPRKIVFFKDQSGHEPFTNWLQSLKDTKAQSRIVRRLRLVERGHFGDFKAVGGGVYELRYFFGAGYRVYFGNSGADIVIILHGGDKSSQGRDIKKAQGYWKEHLNNE